MVLWPVLISRKVVGDYSNDRLIFGSFWVWGRSSKITRLFQRSIRQCGLILGFETRNQLEERGGKISIAAHCVCRLAIANGRTNDDALTLSLCFVIPTILRFHSAAFSIEWCTMFSPKLCKLCLSSSRAGHVKPDQEEEINAHHALWGTCLIATAHNYFLGTQN